MTDSEVQSILDKVAETGEIDEALKAKAALRAESILPYMDRYLYEETKNILSNKYITISSRTHVVRFLGLKASQIGVAGAAKRLAEELNKVCAGLQVLGSLGEPLKVDLFFEPNGTDLEPMAAYVAYIAVTHEAGEIIDQILKSGNKLFFQEGECPSLTLETETQAQA
jgi:hypothetical protein